jgi:hypothetical protein
MGVARAAGCFRTPRSACVHAKRGTLPFVQALSLRTTIAGKGRADRLNFTAKRIEAKERAMTKMSKTLTALTAAATIAVAAVAVPQPAQAHYHGGGIAAGIIGGLAAGAILGAAASGPHYYGPGYYYGAGPVYYRGPDCYWTHRRFWDGWGWHVRRVRVCD